MSTTHNRPKTMAELGTSSRAEVRELPDWMKVTVNVLFVTPFIGLLLAYFSDTWKPVKGDSYDGFIISSSFFACVFGLIAINFAIKYLEDRR